MSLLVCSARDNGQAEPHPSPGPLAEGRSGMVVGTTGPATVHAGLEMLQGGGSAADAAMATALAQVVECGGAYVSHAGILGMLYYEAASGKALALNACYNTPREENDPLSIPPRGTPSGWTALVPGFMAGVQATLDRFGKLPRQRVFAPAIALAEEGFPVSPMLAGFFRTRQDVLQRLPETKRLFTKPDGSFYAQGEHLRQPQLAHTLRQVSDRGAAYMYTGDWAQRFVAAVRQEGGKITLQDLQEYQVLWEEPLQTSYRGHQVCVPGFSAHGGVTMVEALHLLERADLRRFGTYTRSPESLFWLLQIGHCQVHAFLPPGTRKDSQGRPLTPSARVQRETAEWIWKQLQDGSWPYAAKRHKEIDPPPLHSDGVVVVDRWGNLAAVTHSINTVLWGSTGLFVEGVSIPDSATFQQAAIQRAGPGKRLPDPMCPLIVLRDGKPVLGSSAIGGGLHQKSLQVLVSVLDFGRDAQAAAEAPAFLLPEYTASRPVARVEQGTFDPQLLDGVKALGQPVKVLTTREAVAYRGYWVGVQLQPRTGRLLGAGTRQLPSRAEGY